MTNPNGSAFDTILRNQRKPSRIGHFRNLKDRSTDTVYEVWRVDNKTVNCPNFDPIL